MLARTLVELGHTVIVFTSTPTRGHIELTEGYIIYRSTNLLTFIRLARTAELVLIKGGVSAFAGLGAMLGCVPRIIIWHEMTGPYEHLGNTWKVRTTNFIRRLVARRACAHVGVTQACLDSKSILERPKGRNNRVIYNPVSEELDTAAKAPESSPRKVDILFVGRLIEGKGILVLAEALCKLDQDGYSLRVRIVGDGGDRERMETSLRDVRTLSVTFAGSETGEALAQSYASARVLVVPTTHPEGMGMVVAEGMAFGLPVIVSDQAALKEVVGNAGIIVRNGDAEDLASAVRNVLGDKQLWQCLSDRARCQSKMFSMSNFRRSVADLLGNVSNQTAGAGIADVT